MTAEYWLFVTSKTQIFLIFFLIYLDSLEICYSGKFLHLWNAAKYKKVCQVKSDLLSELFEQES